MKNTKLCDLLNALKNGEQIVTPDLNFGADGCHGLELYKGRFYAKGVGSALGDRVSEWLTDLILNPEKWMEWSEFNEHREERYLSYLQEYDRVHGTHMATSLQTVSDRPDLCKSHEGEANLSPAQKTG